MWGRKDLVMEELHKLRAMVAVKDKEIEFFKDRGARYFTQIETREKRLDARELTVEKRIDSLFALIENPEKLKAFKEAVEMVSKQNKEQK